jgi:hypothetical protein
LGDAVNSREVAEQLMATYKSARSDRMERRL